MNTIILDCMKWLNNSESVSQEKLRKNVAVAYAAAAADAADADDVDVVSVVDAYATAATYYAAYAACYADYYAAYDYAYVAARERCRNWVDTYYKRSGENKQDYIDEIEATK